MSLATGLDRPLSKGAIARSRLIPAIRLAWGQWRPREDAVEKVAARRFHFADEKIDLSDRSINRSRTLGKGTKTPENFARDSQRLFQQHRSKRDIRTVASVMSRPCEITRAIGDTATTPCSACSTISLAMEIGLRNPNEWRRSLRRREGSSHSRCAQAIDQLVVLALNHRRQGEIELDLLVRIFL